MNRNIIITLAILCCMLALAAGFAVFLWWIITLSKRYGEKLLAVSQAKTVPTPLILKSSPFLFSIALVHCCLYTVTFFIFRFLLGKVNWVLFQPTIPFFLAVFAICALLLVELFGTICALAGFALRQLSLDGSQAQYRNWTGRTVTFNACDVITCRTIWIGGFFLHAKYLRFVDTAGKKRCALMYLSEYSSALLEKYLNSFRTGTFTQGSG